MKHSTTLLSVILLLVCISCASKSKNLNLTSLKDDEGVFYGKVKVAIDEEDVTKNCYVGSRDSNDDRVYVSLGEDGLFSGISKTGANRISELRCRRGIRNFTFLFENNEHTFQNVGKGQKSYFGDLVISWNSQHDNTNYALFLLGGIGGAIAANQSQDLKTLKVQVVDNNVETTSLFQTSIQQKETLKVFKSLITMPIGRDIANQK